MSRPLTYGSVCSGNARNLTGVRNGRLVAVSVHGRTNDGHVTWLCRCDCGGEKVIQSNNLLRVAGSRSCGCLARESGALKRAADGAWNEGRSYAINDGERCYKTRHGWAKAVMRALGNSCERCGWDKARCDVHHRIPKAQGGKHTIANGVVLCPNCHRVEHEGTR